MSRGCAGGDGALEDRRGSILGCFVVGIAAVKGVRGFGGRGEGRVWRYVIC